MMIFPVSQGVSARAAPKRRVCWLNDDFGPPFYKFEKVHKISTNRIEIFGQTTIKMSSI